VVSSFSSTGARTAQLTQGPPPGPACQGDEAQLTRPETMKISREPPTLSEQDKVQRGKHGLFSFPPQHWGERGGTASYICTPHGRMNHSSVSSISQQFCSAYVFNHCCPLVYKFVILVLSLSIFLTLQILGQNAFCLAGNASSLMINEIMYSKMMQKLVICLYNLFLCESFSLPITFFEECRSANFP